MIGSDRHAARQRRPCDPNGRADAERRRRSEGGSCMADVASTATAHPHCLLRRIDPHPLQRRVDHQANVTVAPGPLIRRREWRPAGCCRVPNARATTNPDHRRPSARGMDRPKSKCLSPGAGRENGGKYLRLAARRTETQRHPHEMRNAAGAASCASLRPDGARSCAG